MTFGSRSWPGRPLRWHALLRQRTRRAALANSLRVEPPRYHGVVTELLAPDDPPSSSTGPASEAAAGPAAAAGAEASTAAAEPKRRPEEEAAAFPKRGQMDQYIEGQEDEGCLVAEDQGALWDDVSLSQDLGCSHGGPPGQ